LTYDDSNSGVIGVSNTCESCGGAAFLYEYDPNTGLLKKAKDANDPNTAIYEYEYENGVLTDIYLGEANDSNHIRELERTSTGGGSYILDTFDYTDADHYRVTREYRTSAGIATKRIKYEDPNEDPDDPNDEFFVEHIVYFRNSKNTVIKKVVIPPSADANDPPDPNSGIRKEYMYDPNTGDLLTEIWFGADDVNFTVSEYKYEPVTDACGTVWETRVTSYTDARGAKTEYFYSDGNAVDPDLKVMPEVNEGISGVRQLKYEYEYDNRGRVTLEKQLDESNSVLVQTKYEYDSYGNLVKRCDDYDYGDSNEPTEYKYNGFNEMVRMKLPSEVVSGKRYNNAGKVESEFVAADVNAFNESDDSVLKLISQTRYEYDVHGRVAQVAKANDANESGFRFDQPEGWVYTKYEYDMRGNRTKVIEDVNGLELVTTYEYNNQGEVTRVTLPNGKWTKTYRDGRGLVTKTEVGHDSETVAATEFQYDGNGNMTWQQGADEYWTRYEYDDFDRLVKVTKGL
jgi:YD repeat-containing protein